MGGGRVTIPNHMERVVIRASRDDRAQSAIDFLFAIALFGVAIGFVTVTVGGVFDDLQTNGDEAGTTVDADAYIVVQTLSEQMLSGTQTPPGQLEASCVESFFSGQPPDACGDMNGLSALPSHDTINITMRQDGELASINGTTLSRGPSIPVADGDAPHSHQARIVTVNGTVYELHVEVW